MCWQSVECDSKEHAAETSNQSNKRMNWKATDVRKECSCDRTFWTSTDVLQDMPRMCWNRAAHRGVPSKNRTRNEPDINPSGASSVTADTPKRGETEQGSSAGNENLLAGCIAAANELFCDTPSVDLSRDRTALSGKFPEDGLKAGRELKLRNMLNFDALELVDELPPGKHAYDMVWADEWRGDRVRSRLCVRQFTAEGLRDDLFAATPDTFFIKYFLAKAASLQGFWITRC